MKVSILSLFFMSVVTSVMADSTFGNTSKYAWGANSGWISFRHDQPSSPDGVVCGGAFLSGYAYSSNLGWINFGNGSPANGYAYANNSAADFGVNHDGAGNLSGYAWSANCGWINFGWASVSDSNRPRVLLLTGVLTGFAYSANTGWLNLGSGVLTTLSLQDTDSDADGIPDWWEKKKFANLTTAHASSDRDGDGVSDQAEFRADTDPSDASHFLQIISHSHNLGISETTLSFTSSPSRLYRIEYSNHLAAPWDTSALGTFSPDSGTNTTKTISYPGNARKFFRAIAVVPLAPTP